MIEVDNLIQILEETKKAMASQDSVKLKELSNHTVHSASILQDTDSIAIAVLVYALSKITERAYYLKIKNWHSFSKKINLELGYAIQALRNKKPGDLSYHLHKIRKTMNSNAINIKQMIQDVLRKAAINKASKIYEHGISMEQTAKLLGITQWELLEYTGQTPIVDSRENITLDIKERAKMTLEFFS